jgi:aspartyl/asparaginyl beta-hydroxylase (cupin superfamily)
VTTTPERSKTVNIDEMERRHRWVCETVRRRLESEGLPTDGVDFLAHGLRHGRDGIEPSPNPLHQPGRHYPDLTARPWWDPTDFPWLAELEAAAPEIATEADVITGLPTVPEAQEPNLTDAGEWNQYRLFLRGNEFRNNTRRCPRTVEIIHSISGISGAAHAGNVLSAKFAVTEPGTHMVPHCGPHNARLRVHLGLRVPKGNSMRVCDDVRSWEEGRATIFDDSFEHEVWNKGNARRIVLLLDVWHPDMTQSQIFAVRYSEGLRPVVETPKDR